MLDRCYFGIRRLLQHSVGTLTLGLILIRHAHAADEYFVSDGLKSLFSEQSLFVKGDDLEGRNVRFRLFVPEHVSGNARIPLIVWLHGAGESGVDNYRQLLYLEEAVFPGAVAAKSHRFAMLAPQCPDIHAGWDGDLGMGFDMIDVTKKMIDYVAETYPIDTDRITAFGVSSGGNAVWELAERYPKMLAAILPAASSPRANLNIDTLKQIPCWAFFSPIDSTAKVAPVRDLVRRVQAAGGASALTLIADHADMRDHPWTHYCFTRPFRELGLLDWMLAQSKAIDNDPSPGEIPLSTMLSARYFWPRLPSEFKLLMLLISLVLTIGVLRKVGKSLQAKSKTES